VGERSASENDTAAPWPVRLQARSKTASRSAPGARVPVMGRDARGSQALPDKTIPPGGAAAVEVFSLLHFRVVPEPVSRASGAKPRPVPAPSSPNAVRVSGQRGAVAPSSASAGAAVATRVPPEFVQRIFTVAWMSILLGFAVEMILLAVAAGMSGGLGKPAPFVADLIQKVSWSFLICVGIAIGTAASKLRPAVMGGLGFIAAPTAFAIAKAAHKGAAAALGLAGLVGGPSPLLIALLKAAQYGVFGVLLGRLSSRPGASFGSYAATGLGVGVIFGGVITTAIALAGATGTGLVVRGLNELIFPLGCALVLYVADALKGKGAEG